MIIYNIEQGSEAWFAARCGRITGTKFKTVMSGLSTDGYKKLITNLVCEQITGKIEESYTDKNMQNGIELEPEARKAYEDIVQEVKEVGFITPDEDNEFHEWIGVSPDGLTEKGEIEIKCPLAKTLFTYIEKDVFPNDYKWQVQGQLFVTQKEYCDFVSYHPEMKMFIKRVYPDLEMHKALEERLRIAIQDVKDKLSFYNNYNEYEG